MPLYGIYREHHVFLSWCFIGADTENRGGTPYHPEKLSDNVSFQNKLVEVDNAKIKLQIWDTAGQERFRSVTSAYYRDADALLLVYDISNRNSFTNIRNWLAQVKEFAKDSVLITLIGNKMDLHQQRKVKYDEGKKLAEDYNIAFIETSAKTGQNVHEAFQEMARYETSSMEISLACNFRGST
ncbi:unnamed protein product [Anisakis simplex]|uniref:Ras-related protein Rab-26 (inferred by orthology to a D. melanogaster protein) n=1 Tax=Anisakis simplex TaxID=6269 RepID=A0A0M3KBZ6_ANISI|nr:unnamed protein product [Anisakis simplex]